MRRTTEQMIQEASNDGYELVKVGYGSYDEEVRKYKDAEHDARYWYIKSDILDTKKYVIYVKERSRKVKSTKKVATVDYTSMTVKELRKICSEKKVKNYSKLSKEEIVARLNAAG